MARLLKADIEALKDLQEEEMMFLARDKKGKLWAFADEHIGDIEKEDGIWICEDYCKSIEKKLFKLIKWEDEKPTSIEELMKEVK